MNFKPVDWSKWETKGILFNSNRGRCRTCSHAEPWHFNCYSYCEYDYGNETRTSAGGFGLTIIVPKQVEISKCVCFEYVPGDNLAYLEWCHTRKK